MKQLIAVLLFAFAALALNGCKKETSTGSNSGTTSGPTPAAPAGPEEKVLNLYSWSEYFPKEVLEQFTAKTGIKVNLALFSTNEELIGKVQSGVGDQDLVVPSDYAVHILWKGKKLRELDRSKIPNFANLDPKQLNQGYDPGNKYSLPYFWGTTGLGINKEVIKEPVDSWAVLFDEKNSQKISMLKEARECFIVPLKLMGKSVNETDPAVLAQAADRLKKQFKLVKSYDSDSFDDKLRTGEAAFVHGFNGQLAKVVRENPAKFTYVVPKEGAIRWIDNLAIPVTARHPQNAHAFINFILEPEVGGAIVNAVGYASANVPAKKFVKPEIVSDPNVYPGDDVLNRCEVMQDVGKTTTLIERLWTEIKAQ